MFATFYKFSVTDDGLTKGSYLKMKLLRKLKKEIHIVTLVNIVELEKQLNLGLIFEDYKESIEEDVPFASIVVNISTEDGANVNYDIDAREIFINSNIYLIEGLECLKTLAENKIVINSNASVRVHLIGKSSDQIIHSFLDK
jgi:hypothetical protein